MNWEAIGAVGEVGGAIAVVATRYPNSLSSAFASFRSCVSKPSVNQS